MAEALYRKYRPQVFGDVVGQDHIERTLRNAIEQDKVSHAYLFCGPRGTGKTTTARLLAKALLCEKAPTPEPDGSCPECQAIAAGEHPDVYELDAASRTGVENVREEIIGRVQFAPTRGSKKVYIIDEIHMLSTAAFNALLKTLEEPPSHVVFILCTTDPQKVPETIHSRCQRFDFRRIASEEMVTRLGAICMAEGVEFEGDALDLIAHRADGGMRNALTALEQAIAYGTGKVTLETVESLVGSLDTNELAQIVSAIGRRDVPACFAWTAAYVETGADPAQFARDLAERVRTMYVLSIAGPDAPAGVSDAERRELASEIELFGSDRLARMLGVLGDLISELKSSTNARLSFEIALTRMARPESDLTLASLAERIEELERRLASGGAAPAAAGGATTSDTGAASASSAMHPTGSAAERAVTNEGAGCTESSMSSLATEGRGAEEGLASPVSESAATEPHSPSSDVLVDGAPVTEGLAAKLANPAALQRAWQAAVATIKQERTAYAALLVTAKAAFDAGLCTLSIVFPAESAFAFKAVQRPEVVEVISDALAGALGERVAFSFVQEGFLPQSAAMRESRPEPQAEEVEPRAPGGDPGAEGSEWNHSSEKPQPEGDDAHASVREPQSAGAGQKAASAEPQGLDAVSSASLGSQEAPFPGGMPDDEVPVDLYDDVPVDVYETGTWELSASRSDEGSARNDRAASSRSSNQAAGSSAVSPSGRAGSPASDPSSVRATEEGDSAARAVSGSPPRSGADAGAAQSFDRERADLENLLSASFGERVVVEEV